MYEQASRKINITSLQEGLKTNTDNINYLLYRAYATTGLQRKNGERSNSFTNTDYKKQTLSTKNKKMCGNVSDEKYQYVKIYRYCNCLSSANLKTFVYTTFFNYDFFRSEIIENDSFYIDWNILSVLGKNFEN